MIVEISLISSWVEINGQFAAFNNSYELLDYMAEKGLI